MNYISIFYFVVLLLAVTSVRGFTSTGLYLNRAGAKLIADNDANRLREKVKGMTFKNMKRSKKILFLNLDVHRKY